MRTIKWMLVILLAGLIGINNLSAQIGYQVSLLNSATGEARANEKVTVNISLSNSEGAVFYNETEQATTNDFGVLNLTIGNKDTFEDVDFSKLPFFISVTVNGMLVGRTQVLTVPVSEAAKKLVPIDKDKIVGTWHTSYGSFTYSFGNAGIGHFSYPDKGEAEQFSYELEGNTICIYMSNGLDIFKFKDGKLYADKYVLHK